MNSIVEPQYVKTSGRPIGKVSDDKIKAYIVEAERLHVKPILGDELYIRIIAELEKDAPLRDEAIVKLLEGGTYTSCLRNKDGEMKLFSGLKVAISYFVYAQNVMCGDFESTRFGTVLKENDYSSHISSKERSDNYNNVTEIANAYLEECVEYCRAVGLIKKPGASRITIGGVQIKKIGR